MFLVFLFDVNCHFSQEVSYFPGRGGGSDRGGGSYGAGREMEVQQDTIFVSNMGQDVTEEQLIQHFGSIGVIKVHMSVYAMWMFLR